MRAGFRLGLQIDQTEREAIADLVFDMRDVYTKNGQDHKPYRDGDLIRIALNHWLIEERGY